MCGSDGNLLETRRMILERAGYKVDVAKNLERARQLLEQNDRQYVALLTCHTIPIDLQDALRGISSAAGVPICQMEKLLFPGDLVKQVSSLMRQR